MAGAAAGGGGTRWARLDEGRSQGFPRIWGVSSWSTYSVETTWDLGFVSDLPMKCPLLSSVTKSRPTPCNPLPCNMPGFLSLTVSWSLLTRIHNIKFAILVQFSLAQWVTRLPTMWETRVRSLGREDPLEKEMATHSSTLAWKIPWTEKPGRLQSMGSQRVRHD